MSDYLFHPATFLNRMRNDPFFVSYVFGDNDIKPKKSTFFNSNSEQLKSICKLLNDDNRENNINFNNIINVDKKKIENKETLEITFSDEKKKIFTETKIIGKGTFGAITLYLSDENQSIVEKYFRKKDDFNNELIILNILKNMCKEYIVAYYTNVKNNIIIMNRANGSLDELFDYSNDKGKFMIERNLSNIFYIFYKIIISYNCIYKRTGLFYTDVKLENILWKCEKDIDDIKLYMADYGGFNKYKDGKLLKDLEFSFPSKEAYLYKPDGNFDNIDIRETVFQLGILLVNILIIIFKLEFNRSLFLLDYEQIGGYDTESGTFVDNSGTFVDNSGTFVDNSTNEPKYKPWNVSDVNKEKINSEKYLDKIKNDIVSSLQTKKISQIIVSDIENILNNTLSDKKDRFTLNNLEDRVKAFLDNYNLKYDLNEF